MAHKTGKFPPDVQSLRKAVSRFTKQMDRGTALVAAAWLDDVLESCLRAHFRPNKSIMDELFRPDGPLGSFSARIKLAYLLGLIGDRLRMISIKFENSGMISRMRVANYTSQQQALKANVCNCLQHMHASLVAGHCEAQNRNLLSLHTFWLNTFSLQPSPESKMTCVTTLTGILRGFVER